MPTFLESALYYESIGFSVIPIIPGQKKPLVKWQQYQSERATPEQIKTWWNKTPNANIGIVTGEISDLFVVDIDTEEGQQSLLQYGFESIIAPTVSTPRGGQHLYFKYPLNSNITIGAGIIKGTDFRGNNGYILAPPSINGTGKAYEWVINYDRAQQVPPPAAYINIISTNDLYRGRKDLCKIDVRSDNLQDITNLTDAYIGNIWESGKRDDNLYHVCRGLRLTGDKEDYLRQVLRAIIWSWGERDEKWITDKINSVLKKEEIRNRNLIQEIKDYILIQKTLQEPCILLTETFHTLQILTKEQKNNAYVAISRICGDKNLIVKQEDKRGIYRILYNEKETAKMDLMTEPDVVDVPVKMPLELSTMCVLSPGNIIVVAGSKSAGKTAFLLNIASFNQYDFEVVYLNSEMSETEFKKRMKKVMPLKDWKITGYKCHNNFDDYVVSDPHKIYIVDYLEVHENFYEIAKPIRKIHEKLGDSLCFIGVQMRAGATLGRGGDFSAEKARLYLTMDYQESERKSKVTIYDAKEPRPPHESVRGMWRMTKILNGSSFSYSPQDNWHW